MTTQPKPLFLADVIDNDPTSKAHHDEAAFELRRLHAENEALRADAERYRWLRGEVEGPHIPLAQVVWKLYSIRDSENWTNLSDGYSLDEHIDAARSVKDSLTVDAIDAAKEQDMTTLREAATQALEALKSVQDHRPNDETNSAITALRDALAEPEPQRKPLTDKEKITLVRNWFAEDWAIEKAIGLLEDYERAIEQAHGIGSKT